jgi:fido (protein-threonine AMPylation protein)
MGRYWKRGCPAWEEDIDGPQARDQLERVLKGVIADDCRMLPSEEMAKAWHRALFDGLVPHPDYLGGFRDVEKTAWCLQGHHVRVGGIRGVPCERVLEALATFFKNSRSRIVALDRRWQEGQDEVSVDDIDEVVELAAWAHGEWVRIHPFANGNGRTARLWANYVFRRYGLLPIVVVKLRPDEPYGIAARASMELGTHALMKQLFWELLFQSYQEEGIIESRPS